MNDQPCREMTRAERFRRWLFRLLFAAEYQELSQMRQLLQVCHDIAADYRSPYPLPAWQRSHPAVVAVDALDRRCRAVVAQRDQLRAPKAARFKLEGVMPREQIGEILAGQRDTGAIKAVQALLAHKVIELSDRATDAPHGAYVTAEGQVPAFTADERLHLAGGASTAAELLAELQALVQPREEVKSA